MLKITTIINRTHQSLTGLNDGQYSIVDAIEQLSQNTGWSTAGMDGLSQALNTNYDTLRKSLKVLISESWIDRGDKKRQLRPSEKWFLSYQKADISPEFANKKRTFHPKSNRPFSDISSENEENENTISDISSENVNTISDEMSEMKNTKTSISGEISENEPQKRTFHPKSNSFSDEMSDISTLSLERLEEKFISSSNSEKESTSTARAPEVENDLRRQVGKAGYQVISQNSNIIKNVLGIPKYEIFIEWLKFTCERGKPVRTLTTVHAIKNSFEQHTEAQCRRVVDYSKAREYPILYWEDQADPKPSKSPRNTNGRRSTYASSDQATISKYDAISDKITAQQIAELQR